MLQISQKTFLLGGFIAFVVASAILFTLHNRALDPRVSGDWWAVRFVEPNNPTSLAFEIENYSGIPKGSYQILVDGTLLQSQDFDIADGTITRFDPDTIAPNNARVKIVVTLTLDRIAEEKSLTR